MKSFFHFLTKEKSIYIILGIGLLLRLIFIFIGGKIYYGRPDFFIQRDTGDWFTAFINLCDHGIFTVNIGHEEGKFFRPPGYSFLFGFFYLITLKNYALAWKLLVIAQVIMDTASIYLVSKIAKYVVLNSTGDKKTTFGNLSALLYSIYPFVIVWVPVLYAETSSIFFLLLSIFYSLNSNSLRNVFLSGLFVGIATLIRLQCVFCIPFIAMTYFFSTKNNLKDKIRTMATFSIAVLISYGLWPARNIFLQHRILFSQDLEIGRQWSRDFMAFLDFAYSIRTDHTSLYWEIIDNKEVHWPKQAYLDPEDSILLDSVVKLCRTCGTGFESWKVGEGMHPYFMLAAPKCDSLIDKIFTSLYQKQKTKNALNYWVIVPMTNLEKCFFKFTLYGNKSPSVKLFSGILFIFRSVFVMLGLLGIYIAFKNNFLEKRFLLFVLSYVIVWYFYLSFFYRNMEIRYLLHTDILLLIPAAYVLLGLFAKKNPKEI